MAMPLLPTSWGFGWMPVLAAEGQGAVRLGEVLTVLLWVGLGIVSILAGGLIIYLAKRMARSRSRAQDEGAADQLDTYRRMRDEGLISEREYGAIREQLAGRTKRILTEPPRPDRSED